MSSIYPYAVSLSDHNKIPVMFDGCTPFHSPLERVTKIVRMNEGKIEGAIEYPKIEWSSTDSPVALRILYSRRNQESDEPIGKPIGLDMFIEEELE